MSIVNWYGLRCDSTLAGRQCSKEIRASKRMDTVEKHARQDGWERTSLGHVHCPSHHEQKGVWSSIGPQMTLDQLAKDLREGTVPF